MKLNSITLLARKLLNATFQLAMGPNTYKSVFAQVLEGAFRRDYLTLYIMLYLTEHSQPDQQKAFADCCMDLSRKVLEDLVSLEYILFKGKEAYARKFFDYYHIEAKLDLDFLETAGVTIEQQRRTNINENYNKVKQKFLDSGSSAKRKGWSELTEFLKSQGKLDEQTEHQIEEEANRRYSKANEQPRKAWAGLDTEGMIEVLVRGGVINAWEQGILIRTYIQGNRKNHFSPTDVRVIQYNDPQSTVSESDLLLSLVSTTTAITRMATMFVNEFDIPEETKQAIDELRQAIFTAHQSEDA